MATTRKRKSSSTALKKDANRTPPSSTDPLSEPSRHRRIWGAYLQRGYNRASWARALGAQYTSADRWDMGETTMQLDTFMIACDLLKYSPHELQYGRSAPRAPEQTTSGGTQPLVGHEVELDDAEIRKLLRELDAAPPERAALAALLAGPGRFDIPTAAYVREYVSVEATLRQQGVPAHARQLQAHTAALRVQAQGRVMASPPDPR